MSNRKKIYSCNRCVQLFSGRVDYDYHMNAHRRTDPPKVRELPARRPRVCYDASNGNEPVTLEGEAT